jgi:quinol monooxygenase YgiN
MTPYVIIVDFQVHAGTMARFMELILLNARASLKGEPGCERFDVLVPKGSADRVVLYEIYRDAEAFAAHCRSLHFHAFDAAAKTLVRDKTVTELSLMQGVSDAAAD